jgi:hypothetical protein
MLRSPGWIISGAFLVLLYNFERISARTSANVLFSTKKF